MTAAPPEAQHPIEAPCHRDTPCTDCATRNTAADGSGAIRCTAWSKSTGHRCDRARTPGTTVCASHGSRAPQVRRAAQLRLVELIDPAIATLAREMTTAKNSSDRQRAANSLLDRAGMPRRTEVDHGAAQAMLVARIQEMLARRELGESEQHIVDAEIVVDPDERMEA